jgi:hypothetical protein
MGQNVAKIWVATFACIMPLLVLFGFVFAL